jgi:hypothetical protein
MDTDVDVDEIDGNDSLDVSRKMQKLDIHDMF